MSQYCQPLPGIVNLRFYFISSSGFIVEEDSLRRRGAAGPQEEAECLAQRRKSRQVRTSEKYFLCVLGVLARSIFQLYLLKCLRGGPHRSLKNLFGEAASTRMSTPRERQSSNIVNTEDVSSKELRAQNQINPDRTQLYFAVQMARLSEL